MNEIELQYLRAKETPSDMNEHMVALLDLAKQCDHIVEGGIRHVVSTWAFILGCACRGGIVYGYCWNRLPQITRAEEICNRLGLNWFYHDGDWLQQEVPETDLLMIDTNHSYTQLTEELRLHGPKARKYIVMHDTTTFADVGFDGTKPGLWKAIEEFLDKGGWRIKHRYTHNHGLTILEKEPSGA